MECMTSSLSLKAVKWPNFIKPVDIKYHGGKGLICLGIIEIMLVLILFWWSMGSHSEVGVESRHCGSFGELSKIL